MTAKPGAKNCNAKISDDDAWQIRRLRAERYSLKSLAQRFGITPSQVSKIALGRQWRHHLRGRSLMRNCLHKIESLEDTTS